MDFSQSLSEWAKDKPLSILQLDPADRAVLKIADERDAIQKKTFTKWLNKHLKKHWRYLETYTCLHVCYSCRACCTPGANRHIDDLFEDLRDGHNLISLLEVLSGELLPRERGRMRFHQLQNVQMALDFLKKRSIKLVNIRPEDIVDGNPKLTLGLIWTIILHFQISDIITGLTDETVTARDALLKWAQRTTERYPGVRIMDFTSSWKDGLAFNAILHRNRPDLLDFRSLRTRSAKENLELAFSIAEKEFGITRLLDPEDVDTPEPDEKSLITYISSMYDVFQEPPAYHPFADEERNRKIEEYKDLAKNLHIWMHESMDFLCSQKTYTTLIDLKSMLLESSKFRSEEMPKRNRDKQRLANLHRDIQKMSRETSHVEFLNDLKLEEIEKKWNLVVNTLQERDKKIRDEICKLEKLQKLVEKFNRESKISDGKLDDLERRIKEEEKRVQRLHFVDAKHNCDQIENELKHVDELLKSLKKDIVTLEDKKYHQTAEMKNRLGILRDRYENLFATFQSHLQYPLAQRLNDKNGDEKKVIKQHIVLNDKGIETKALISLKEHFEWIDKKYKRLNQIEFGIDYPSVKSNVEQLKQENKTIEQYNKKIVACSSQKLSKENDIVYTDELERLQSKYKELVQFSLNKIQEAESLLDFVQSATRELKWMNDKEETEVSRDWSAKNLNLVDLEHHQEILTSDLEKREIQFNAVQSRGESLLLQKHSAAKCIEGFLTKMQSQWSWLLQLTLCLEIHLRYAQIYHQYFKEIRECEQWIKKTEEKLNSTFSKSIFSIDEGERYLKEMQDLKEELARYNSVIASVLERSSEILPLKQRRSQPQKPLTIISICNYKSSNTSVAKDDKFVLKDASQKVMWKVVTPSGNECSIPGVCFIIPPPNTEALESGKSLKKKYDDLLNLWALKQRKLRQNMILATIKVVKSWDASQLHTIDVSQRESIMRALNADAEKLLCEGSSSEPALIKIKEEIEQCNVVFSSLVKKLSEDENEKSPKSAGRKLSDCILSLQNTLNEKEKFLRNKLLANILWDLDSLESQVIEHKDFETGLKMLDEQITQIAETFKNTNRKTTALQMKYDTLVNTWDKIWELSNSYIEKLKAVEVAIHHLNEAIQTVSNIEVQLASCDKMSSDLEDLRKLHDNLLASMQQSQSVMDDVQESVKRVKDLIQRIRPKQINHTDINKYENDVKKLMIRWNNARSQIVERLRSCGATSELLQTYKSKVEKDNCWISETTIKVNSLKSVKRMTTKEIELSVEPTMNLYSNIAEKSSSIEETNTLASRYIREAKIYDLRLKHYKENLEEEHPSLDASLHKKMKTVSGADVIEKEIQDLNHEYSSLLQSVLDYLEQLKGEFTLVQSQKWIATMSAAVPVTLKTYSTTSEPVLMSEGNVFEDAPAIKYQTFSSELKEGSFMADGIHPADKTSNTGLQEFSISSDITVPGHTRSSLEHRTVKPNIHMDELASQNICLVRGIYNPKTGKMVTMYEAVEQGILNFKNEEFSDLRTGRKMSLKEAVIKGFLDEAFYERITLKCGIYYPGRKEELSLVEAIKENVYDIKSGSLLNPLDGKPITVTDAFHLGIIKKTAIKKLISMKLIKIMNLTITEAIEKEFLNPQTGIFHDHLTNSTMTFQDAVEKGFLNLIPETEPGCGISLTEALDQNIIHDQSGQILDQDSGERYTIDEAISKGILRSDVPEVVDVKSKKIVSLGKSIELGIINAHKGKYINNETQEQYSLRLAREKKNILKPLTLKDAFETSVVDDDGINDPLTGKRISLLEALSYGILDSEAKCIVDSNTSELLSLPEALGRGIILPNGEFFDSSSNKEISLSLAINEGLVTTVSHKMIFDIEGIKDSNELISFNTALEKKIINLDKEEFIDTATNESMSLENAVLRGFIQEQIYNMITKPIGIKDGGKELNLIECCQKNFIDCKTGQLKDPKTNKVLYMREAVECGVITPGGAALLKGLMDITVTMATVTRTITRFVDVPSGSKVTEEAMAQEIIEEVKEIIEKEADESILSPDEDKNESYSVTQTSRIQNGVSEINDISVSVKQGRTFANENSYQLYGAKDKHILKEPHFVISEDKVFDSKASDICIPDDHTSMDSADKNIMNKEKLEIKPSVQVLELPPDGWYLKDAIQENLFDPETGLFTVPGTDRLVSFEETVKLEIINPKSALVLVPKSKQTVSLDSALEMRILDSTGHYNTKTGVIFSMQSAIEKNLLFLCDKASPMQSKKISKPFITQISPSGTPFENNQNLKTSTMKDVPKLDILEENLAVNKHTVMNHQLNTFATHISIENSFTKSVSNHEIIFLQKVPKKILSPKDALIEGIIDKETADLLNQATEKRIGTQNNIEFIFNEDRINTEEGKVLDYKSGKFISIKKAIEHGIIDKNSGKILVPIGLPVSFPEALSRGLIHEKSQKIIHPETGDLLNIQEAIMCDIINPLSVFVDPVNAVSMTVAESIHSGIIDSSSGEIHSLLGNFLLSEAISKNYFKESCRKDKHPPLLSLTFPTALQYGYIDVDSKEYIYPSTDKRVSVQKAFDIGDLMVIPVQPQQEYFLIDDALNRKLIDPKTFTFKHPVSGKITDIREAMQSGLLVTKPVRITVTPSSYSTLKEVIGIESNFKSTDDSSKQSILFEDHDKLPLNTAIKKGLLDFNSGTFYCDFMKRALSLSEAIQLGLLKVPGESEIFSSDERDSLYEVLEKLYDNESQKIIDPVSGNQVTFEYLIKNNFVSSASLIYEAKDKHILTLNEAIDMGVIDIKTGEYITECGEKMFILEAAKQGSLVFIDRSLLEYVPVNVMHNKGVIKESLPDSSSSINLSTHVRPSTLSLEYKTDSGLKMNQAVVEKLESQENLNNEENSLEKGDSAVLRETLPEDIFVPTCDLKEYEEKLNKDEYFAKNIAETIAKEVSSHIKIKEDVHVVEQRVPLFKGKTCSDAQNSLEPLKLLEERTEKAEDAFSTIPVKIDSPSKGYVIDITSDIFPVENLKEDFTSPQLGVCPQKEYADPVKEVMLPDAQNVHPERPLKEKESPMKLVKSFEKESILPTKEHIKEELKLHEKGDLSPIKGFVIKGNLEERLVTSEQEQNYTDEESTSFGKDKIKFNENKSLIKGSYVPINETTALEYEIPHKVEKNVSLDKIVGETDKDQKHINQEIKYVEKDSLYNDKMDKLPAEFKDSLNKGRNISSSDLSFVMESKLIDEKDKSVSQDKIEITIPQASILLSNDSKPDLKELHEEENTSLEQIERSSVGKYTLLKKGELCPKEKASVLQTELIDSEKDSTFEENNIAPRKEEISTKNESHSDKEYKSAKDHKPTEKQHISLEKPDTQIGHPTCIPMKELEGFEKIQPTSRKDESPVEEQQPHDKKLIFPAEGISPEREPSEKFDEIRPSESDNRVLQNDLNSSQKEIVISKKEYEIPEKETTSLNNEVKFSEKEYKISKEEFSPEQYPPQYMLVDTISPKERSVNEGKDNTFPKAQILPSERDKQFSEKEFKSTNKECKVSEKIPEYFESEILAVKKGESMDKILQFSEKEQNLPKESTEELISSLRESDSQLKECKSHDKDYKIPEKDFIVPKKESISPEKEFKDQKVPISHEKEQKFSISSKELPQKELMSPETEKTSMQEEPVFREKTLKSPVKQLRSPQKQRVSPEKRQISPQKQYISPEKNHQSPDKEQVSRPKEPISPKKKQRSPEKEQVSPQQEAVSLKKKQKSPGKEQVSPQKDIISPKKKQRSPENEQISPEKHPFSAEKKSPGKEQLPLQKESISPKKKGKSPEIEQTNHVKDQDPIQRTLTSPEKIHKSPEKGHSSLDRKYMTPEVEYKSSGKDTISSEKDENAEQGSKSTEKEDDFHDEGIKYSEKDLKEFEFQKPSSIDTLSFRKRVSPENDNVLSKDTLSCDKEIKTFENKNESPEKECSSEYSTSHETKISISKKEHTFSESKITFSKTPEKEFYSIKNEPQLSEEIHISPEKECIPSEIEIQYTEAETSSYEEHSTEETLRLPGKDTSIEIKNMPDGTFQLLKQNILLKKFIPDETKTVEKDDKYLNKKDSEKEAMPPVDSMYISEKESFNDNVCMEFDSLQEVKKHDDKLIKKPNTDLNTMIVEKDINVSQVNECKPSDNQFISDSFSASENVFISSDLDATKTYSVSQTAISVQESGTEIKEKVHISRFPFQISIKDAITAGIVKPESCYVVNGNNKILLSKAVNDGIFGTNTVIQIISNEEVTIPDEQSSKTPLEYTKAAIEENYKVCEENSAKLTSWMKDIEDKLAEIGILKEQVPGLQYQMNTVKILKDELENQQHLVLTCLDQMRQLAQRGLEVLEKEEINALQKNLISLKRQYDSLLNESDRLLRRLITALEELQKFKSELNNLKGWLVQAEEEFKKKESLLGSLSNLEKNSDTFRNFTSDVISHQADLRFITMAAQKFINESQEYTKALNAFRMNLPKKLSPLKATESEIKSEVHEITTVFHNFMNNVNRLHDNFMIISNKYRSFMESIEKARHWLGDIKKSSKKILIEPIADEPHAVQEQLDKIKLINMEVVGQSRLVENVLQSMKILSDTLENSNVVPHETKVIEDSINSLQNEYSELVNSIASRIKELQTALIQSQDIQDAVDRIMKWLEETENTMKHHNRPVSLIIEKLDEQVQEFKILKSDVDSQKQSIDMLFSSAKELNDSTNPKLVKKVDAKLKDISQRFEKLCEKILKRGTLLEQVSNSVRMFQSMAVQFDEWSSSTLERIDSTDNVHQMDLDGFSSVIEYTLNQCNSRKEDFESMIKIGKNLITKRDITDVTTIKDKIQTLEQKWKNLENTLNEKKLLGKAKADQIAAYDSLRTKVLDWLLKMEREVEKLEPLAIDQMALKRQASEIMPLLKEHSDFSPNMEKLNSLGSACDATIKGESSKQKAASPLKKASSPTRKSPSKSKSTDSFSVSPVKAQVSAQSPLSTVSSGFSSRRSSTDNIGGMDELTPIQFQMSEMNDRYTNLGVKLSDRNQEINLITEEIKNCHQIMKSLNLFLEEKEKHLPKEELPSKDGIEKQLKSLKNIHNEFLEKQSELDNLKTKTEKMLSKRKMVKGAAELEDDFNKIEKKWTHLLISIKQRITFLQDLKEFQETQLILKNWLAQKQKMFGVLGPIASDPRMISTQVQQVQVMRDEFTSQKSFIDRLNDLATTVLEYLKKNNLNTNKINEQMDTIHELWNDMSVKLNEREKNLEAASGVTKDFHKNLTELQAKLQQLNEKFEKFEEKGFTFEVSLKKLMEMEDELEKLRLLLTDADSVCEQLCEILSDSTSKTDIKYKVSILETSYTTLRKKIDNKKAEIESSLKEDNTFFKSCTDIQNWITEMESLFSQPLSLSASLPKLTKQNEDYEPVYKQIMNREYEVHLCLNKGNEMLTKLTVKQDINALKTKLENIKKIWEKLKNLAVGRNTSLRSALETCKKYSSSVGSFLPWLESEEQIFKKYVSTTLQREALNRQLKDLQTLKSNLSVHLQEYENLLQVGENLLSVCETDNDATKKELDNVKKKWKKLNESVINKIQSLEDVLQMLMEFEEKVRDSQHSLQRLEDRLYSHDALGDVSHDPIILERLQGLLAETKDMNKEIKKVKDFSKHVIDKSGSDSDSSEITNTVSSLQNRYQSLLKNLEERCVTMQASYKVISVFMEHVKSLKAELNVLDEGFDKMNPVARDQKVLQDQLKEIKVFKMNLSKAKEKLTAVRKECDNIINEHHLSESKSYMEQINTLERLLCRLEERVKIRESTLEAMVSRLENYLSVYSVTMKSLKSVLKEEESFEVIGGDVDAIRSQQQAFKEFREAKVLPLNKQIGEANKLGQGLVQSATTGVSTSDIEQQLEKLNSLWNKLQESINEREKKLDIALLQSGKFQEALTGVEKWLKDTEEMVSNQKGPSSDYKVVKAQIQEQKFLKKMLLDRQNSVISLKSMGTELMSASKTAEFEQAEKLMRNITVRFEKLISTAEKRMSVLEETIPLAQDFQSQAASIEEWLEVTEKKLLAMSSVPAEEERLKAIILEHKKLTEDISSYVNPIERLRSIAEKLIKIINVDESEILKQKIISITDKFSEIKQSCENMGCLLKDAHKGIGSFTTSYVTVITWIETTTIQLTSYQVLSVSSDKLRIQIKELKNLKSKLESERTGIDNVVKSGEKIMKITSGEDAIHMKEKLDTLNMKLTEVSNRLNERLKTAETSLPLVEAFFSANKKLTHWLESTERTLKVIENNALESQDENIKKLEKGVHEYREVLEIINHTGPRLCELSPGEGSASIESLITRANQRFERVCEQVQRKAERIRLAVQRKYDVIGDIDELHEWFQETEKQISDAEGLSSEPDSLLVLLNKQKSLNEEVNGQRNRVRDIVTAAKKLMRESSSEDLSFIHEKIEKLKGQTNSVSNLCHERISALEQALPLAEHFFETHTDLGQWLDEVEGEAELLEAPGLNTVQIKKQQDKNKGLIQSVQEHKPLVDKLNKTGSALTKLCKDEESDKLEVILESDNSRYNALRKILREHQIALEEALQATSQFSDKLEGMLSALTSTADQLHNAEPISAHPERIQEQINDNKAVLQDLDKRTITLEAVKKAADDVIGKASSIDEPAVRDIKVKLDRLNDLWITIQTAAKNRGKSLEEALIAAEKFWEELTAVMKALKELQGNLNGQEPPAVEPAAVQQQQEVLHEIQQEISQTKPEVDQCRQAGQNLMELCGEPDKPEVKRHIEDLDSAWENVTTLYAKREQNLIDAMEKAMQFHETLHNLLEFLDTVEERFTKLGAVSSDIDSVKSQIDQLKVFKLEVDPHMIEVESLNRQAQELMERTSSDQAVAIREPLADINKRWDDLLKNIVERQQEMENTLLRLGQFQHALEELVIWISKTEKTLDELKPVFGDPQVIEVVLAKHKVISNDILAHQTSMDTINRAGHEFMDSDRGSEDAKFTHNKLQDLNIRWQNLQNKASDRYKELEDALKEAQQFHQDIQDMLMWLNDIDGQLVTSKPVGGLPETSKEQLNRFLDLYNELDSNRYKIESIMQQGDIYLKRSGDSSTKSLQHNLQTLKQRWESIMTKAIDRKIKLEIAFREATEFNEALQNFVEWLTNAEKYLTTLKPVSRHMNSVLEQIDEHRNFQKDVGAHRELMINLDKKGTHLKYFSQKQDVILIKNLLISVQHRWERVVSKAAERTRALDHGYKEAKEFHDAWTSLSSWLDEAEKLLDSTTPIGNDPVKIKKLLSKHKEFQRTLGSKQITYDATMKSGRILKDKCPKQDVQLLQSMMNELKARWNKVCSKSVDRQRRLEEALLYSGQFKEAVLALLDWLDKAIASLNDSKPYHGDLDTVTSLIDQHKTFEEELKNRGMSLESVSKTATDLKKEASPADIESISTQVDELNLKWKSVTELNETRKNNLDEALHQAEKLYKMVHILLEWMSDAEMKLRFVGSLPEDEETTKKQLDDHDAFMSEMKKQEVVKNDTLELANIILKKCHPDGASTIRHWITIIQSRWDEICLWSKQRDQRLRDHLLSVRDISELLDELLKWLENAESTLTALEAEPLPNDLPTLDDLIKEHQNFMNDLSKRQTDVDKVSKAFSLKRQSKNVASTPKEKLKDKSVRSATPTSIKTSTPIRAHGEPDIKHPKARTLIDKWRHVWLLAMERQRRLQDKHNYLMELDRIKHFDFNEWRLRYLGWMNNKKSRIMDQFKKIDKSNLGKVTRQEFIEGILKSKFSTSHLEMECVVDVFDRNGDGFIDSKEYIETLRPEREGGPKTDAEKIQDEVQRQVAKCTCVHRFKVYQVGEGKYRFGDSQKLRLVRILRSTVMVRVGGGWVALDEFLVKNDPCRAKGRTNIELREQFILAEGVSQSMAPFKPKPSPNSSVSSQSGTSSMPSTGPITKIREKSERSTPMRQSRSSAENSSDISGPSFSETDSFSNRSGISRNTSSRLSPRNASYKSSSRPSSRPSSRQGSQPSSRAPSDLSQDAIDEIKNKRRLTTSEASKIPSAKRPIKLPSNQITSKK